MANPFDQFDTPAGNPFDQFDSEAPSPYAGYIADVAANSPEAIAARVVGSPTDEELASQIAWNTPVPVGFGVNLPRPIAQGLMENAPRVMAPLGVGLSVTGLGLPAGLALTGLAGAAGELASQGVEMQTGTRQELSLPQIGVGGLLSAVPAAPLGRIASPLIRGGIRIGEGAAISASAPLLEAGLEGRLPGAEDFERAKASAAFGAALGVPFAGIEALPKAPQIPKSTQILADAAKDKNLANIAAETASNTQGSPYALQESINKMVNIQPNPPANAAMQSAEALEAALGTVRADTPTPGAARASAEAILEGERVAALEAASEARRLSAQEGRIQALVDEIAGGDPVLRAQILGRREQLGSDDFLAALEAQADFRRNPANQPDLLAAEVAQVGEDIRTRSPIAAQIQQERFRLRPEFERQNLLAQSEEALAQAEAARLAQPEQVILTSSPANQQLQMLDTRPGNAQAERARLLQQIQAETPALPQVSEPILSPQAQRMQDEFGRVNPQLLSPIAGGGAGAAYGLTQGDTPEERLRNAALYGAAGMAGGALVGKGVSKLAGPLADANIGPSRMASERGSVTIPGGKKQTKTPAFKNFFGDWENDAANASKVVDEKGEPLVVYHGSETDFNQFDPTKISPNDLDAPFNGFWLASEPAEAAPSSGTNRNIRSFYVSIKNPAPEDVWRRVSSEVSRSPLPPGARADGDAVRMKLQEMGYDGAIWNDSPKLIKTDDKNILKIERPRYKGYTLNYKEGEIPGYGKYSGWDLQRGNEVITGYKSPEEYLNLERGKTYVAFSPEQIKSATGNSGKFDPTNSDIRGFTIPQILGPLAGGGAGGVTGFLATERREGESEQEFQARRLLNTGLGVAGGAGLGALPQIASKAFPRASTATSVSDAVGKRLGIINDFPVIQQDVSNAKLRLDRFVNTMMRGTKMRPAFVEAKRKAEASINASMDEARIILADARGKINSLSSKGPERDALEQQLNEVFTDISKVDTLPEPLRPTALKMFKLRQDKATELAALEGLTDSTRDTVLENGGNYLARNYAIFRVNNPLEMRAYKAAIPKQDMDAALDAIQETWGSAEKPINRMEAQSLLNEFLDRDSFLGFSLGRKQIGGKDITSLYQKKELDPRLRKVLGEIKDPLDNAYHSLENQVNLIERDKQQREFIQIGETQGIFTRDPDVATQKGMVPLVESAKEQNSPYDNWTGVYTYPFLRDEFEGVAQKKADSSRLIDAGLGSIKAATAAFKWLKLIPSPDSRSVNLVGAWWNNAVNGRGLNPIRGESADAVKAILLSNGLIQPNGSANTQALMDLRKTLVKHRVLDESTLGRDFAETFNESMLKNTFGKIDEFAQREIDNPGLRKAYLAGRFLASGKEFAAADDIMRVVGFLEEKDRYRKAFPNVPDEELNEIAGRVMNQTGMTYSEVPAAIRQLSQVGILEPFTSFPFSVYRSTVNTARLGAAELQDGLKSGNQQLAKIGAKRLAALGLGAAAASGYGISHMINKEHGVTEEQEAAAKVFAPDYVKDSPLAFDAPVKDGKVQFVQMNYLLPSGLVTSAIEEGVNEAKKDGLASGLEAGAGQVAAQFSGFGDDGNPFGPAITTLGKAMGLINKDDFGRQIWNPQDPKKWDKVAASIGKDWSTGFQSKVERYYAANNPEYAAKKYPGRVFSNQEEFLRFLGRRATTIDVKRLIPTKAYGLYSDYLDASKLYSQEVSREKIAGDTAATAQAYDASENVVNERFNDMVEMVNAARTLKVGDDVIRAGLIQGGIPKRLAAQIMAEVYVPPSKERADALMQAREMKREAYQQLGATPQANAQTAPQANARQMYDRVMAVPPEQRRALVNQLIQSGELNDALLAEMTAIARQNK